MQLWRVAIDEQSGRALSLFDNTILKTETETKKHRLLFSDGPNKIIKFRIARDNRLLYYIRESVEADIWLLQHK